MMATRASLLKSKDFLQCLYNARQITTVKQILCHGTRNNLRTLLGVFRSVILRHIPISNQRKQQLQKFKQLLLPLVSNAYRNANKNTLVNLFLKNAMAVKPIVSVLFERDDDTTVHSEDADMEEEESDQESTTKGNDQESKANESDQERKVDGSNQDNEREQPCGPQYENIVL